MRLNALSQFTHLFFQVVATHTQKYYAETRFFPGKDSEVVPKRKSVLGGASPYTSSQEALSSIYAS